MQQVSAVVVTAETSLQRHIANDILPFSYSVLPSRSIKTPAAAFLSALIVASWKYVFTVMLCGYSCAQM